MKAFSKKLSRRSVDVKLYKNDELVQTGNSKDVMEHCAEAHAWLELSRFRDEEKIDRSNVNKPAN